MKDSGSDDRSTGPWQRQPRSWSKKFASAFHGIVLGVQGQSSFLIHLVAACGVVAAAAVLQLPLDRWCLLVLCIGVVLAAELFNSALEWTCQALTDRSDERIARALDIASGAVLVAAIAAAIVGSMVFLEAALAGRG